MRVASRFKVLARTLALVALACTSGPEVTLENETPIPIEEIQFLDVTAHALLFSSNVSLSNGQSVVLPFPKGTEWAELAVRLADGTSHSLSIYCCVVGGPMPLIAMHAAGLEQRR
jgi:hypothetical protein